MSMYCYLPGLRVSFLALACAIVLAACAASTEHVPASAFKDFRSGAQSYDLSDRERLRCEKKASEGDILAAKRLVSYHMMVPGHDEEYHRWLRVVARLQKARVKQLRERRAQGNVDQ